MAGRVKGIARGQITETGLLDEDDNWRGGTFGGFFGFSSFSDTVPMLPVSILRLYFSSLILARRASRGNGKGFFLLFPG